MLVSNSRLRAGFLGDVDDGEAEIVDRALRRATCQSGSDRSRPSTLFRREFIHVICDPVKFLRTNNKIDMGQILQQRLAARLGHAANKTKNHMRPLFSHATEHSHFAERLLIGHVAHTAGVQ